MSAPGCRRAPGTRSPAAPGEEGQTGRGDFEPRAQGTVVPRLKHRREAAAAAG